MITRRCRGSKWRGGVLSLGLIGLSLLLLAGPGCANGSVESFAKDTPVQDTRNARGEGTQLEENLDPKVSEKEQRKRKQAELAAAREIADPTASGDSGRTASQPAGNKQAEMRGRDPPTDKGSKDGDANNSPMLEHLPQQSNNIKIQEEDTQLTRTDSAAEAQAAPSALDEAIRRQAELAAARQAEEDTGGGGDTLEDVTEMAQGTGAAAVAAAKAAAASAKTAADDWRAAANQELRLLKQQFDSGAITADIYEERRKTLAEPIEEEQPAKVASQLLLLKQQFDSGLITADVYEERRKPLLAIMLAMQPQTAALHAARAAAAASGSGAPEGSIEGEEGNIRRIPMTEEEIVAGVGMEENQGGLTTKERMRTEEEKQLRSLITEASAEGRTRARHVASEDASAKGGARGEGAGTPVVAQTARDKEIRELLLKGVRYRLGLNGSKMEYGGALEAYSAASQLGSLEATAHLGEMYKHGQGVKADLQKAIALFKRAADGGDPVGHVNLAILFSTGVGMEENQAMAVLHYHFAAVGGDHMAQLAMGYRHMHGVGVPKNCQAAVEYYKPAVDVVVHDVQQFRAPPMMERYSLAPEGSKRRPEELDEDVVDYYQYSAARGDPAAQVALGQLYYFGARGIEQSYSEALKWYLLAAEQGDANAMGHIGNMYVQGTHVKACNATALKYFRQGVEKGNGIAMNGLGYMHMYGLGLPQSFAEAMKLFSSAAEQGNLEARFNLGALYVGGHGVSKDYAKAIYYFTLAANRGHMLALYNLAMMHLNGFGTPRSCTNALQFLKAVGERGAWGLRLQQAYKVYQQGRVDEALLLYLEAAELGFEVAQGNVAHMYDEAATPLASHKLHKALAALESSAMQGNAAAELKIGDYYYYGLGTSVNYRKAVAHYRAASEARNAQAMFNLAWMHQYGVGMVRDTHLAKRFYDMAAETSPDALWPVMLCRTHLQVVMGVQQLVERTDAFSLEFTQKYGPKYGIWLPASKVWIPWLLERWDVLLALFLSASLIVITLLRNHLYSERMHAARAR